MQFTSLRKPIAAILMLSMAATTIGSLAQPVSARGVSGRNIADVVREVVNVVQNLKNKDIIRFNTSSIAAKVAKNSRE